MQYALLIYADPTAIPAPDTPEGEATRTPLWMDYTQALAEAGGDERRRGAPPRRRPPPASASATARRSTTDGPFAETKEVFTGFYLLDVPDLDAALAWAQRIPSIGYGTVELRPTLVFDRV